MFFSGVDKLIIYSLLRTEAQKKYFYSNFAPLTKTLFAYISLGLYSSGGNQDSVLYKTTQDNYFKIQSKYIYHTEMAEFQLELYKTSTRIKYENNRLCPKGCQKTYWKKFWCKSYWPTNRICTKELTK